MAAAFDPQHFIAQANLPVDKGPSLARYTTFQLGGVCPAVVLTQTLDELKKTVLYFNANSIEDFLVIGEGSNILFSDEGIPSPVIRYCSAASQITKNGEEITVATSTKLDDLALFCAQEGLEGLGFASGIPGTVGGAIAGNAGAFGKQISDVLAHVRALDHDGSEKEYAAAQCAFGYRQSKFQGSGEIIISAKFILKRGTRETLLGERQAILAQRKDKHPDYKLIPSAGSFFRNIESLTPEGRRQAAGALLDQAGAKAFSVGGAGVFEKHANIIIKKTSNCTSRDVYLLSRQMQDAVKKKFGISLSPEVRLIGKFGEDFVSDKNDPTLSGR